MCGLVPNTLRLCPNHQNNLLIYLKELDMIHNTWVGGMKIDYVKQDTAIPTQIYDFFKLSKELYMIHYTYTYIHVIHNTNTRDFGVSEHYARHIEGEGLPG